MRKLKNLTIILFVLLSFIGKGQTCASPISLSDGNCTGTISISTSPYYYKFTAATNYNYFIKFYIPQLSSNPNDYSVNVYENNCANIPNNAQFVLPSIIGDTLYCHVEGLTGGNDYLAELNYLPGGSFTITPSACLLSRTTSSVTTTCPSSLTTSCDLICNGTFEGMTSPPPTLGSITNFTGWDRAGGGLSSPDALSSSGLIPQILVPCNQFGYEFSKSSGGNYAGIITGLPNTSTVAPYQEVLKTLLTKTMQPGYKYTVSLWVSEADFTAWRTPNLSVYFSNTNYSQLSSGPLTLTPVYTETNTATLNNRNGWRNISFPYTSTVGGEICLMIGSSANYSSVTASPSFTPSCSFINSSNYAYLYIDDVSIIQLTPEILGGTNCTGLTGSFSLSCVPSGTASYFWQWGDGNNSTTSSTTINHTYASSGLYTVTLTTTSGTNTYISNATVSIGAPPTLVISPSANSVCPNSNVLLTASGASSTYTWLPGSYTINPVGYTVASNTTYTALGTAANGCPMSNTITIYTFTDVVTVSGSTTAICAGQSATLSASGGSTYTWQPVGLNTYSIAVSPSSTTIYTLTSTTPNGCSQTKTISLTVNPLPSLTITPNPTNTICAGVTVTLTATGATSYTWLPSTVNSSIAVNPSSTTSYTVNGVSSVGCISTKTISVVVNPIPTINCSTNKPMVCQGSSATLSATGASTYTWNPGSLTGASVVVTPPASPTTNYTVVGTSAAGCTNSCVVTQSVFLNGTSFFSVSSSASVICNAPASNSTLTATGSPNTYTWLPGSTVASSIVINTAGIYSVSSTNSLGCLGTKTIEVTATDNYAGFSGLPVICGIQPLDLSAYIIPSGGGSTYTVNGTPITGSTYTFSSAGGTYTVGYTYTAGILCNNTATAIVTTNSACCTSTHTQITSAVLSGTMVSGPMAINQSFTVTGNTWLQDGEFVIAPNVKITVAAGADLHLSGAHLYACQDKMWDGIEVQFDGSVVSGASPTTSMSTFIEDAKIAINLLPITSTPPTNPMPIEVANTIFNKNFIAVNINTVTLSNDLDMQFRENVLTCRTLTFNMTSWPTTSTVSPGLRCAVNPTTGLTAPYTLQAAAQATVLTPYAGLFSYAGFQLTNVANSGYGIEIGESQQTGPSSDPQDFNLFDGMSYGIIAENSNVSVINNVFQNSRKRRAVGAGGILYNVTNDYFYKLNLTNTTSSYSLTPAVGNRFWDVNFAVEATKVYNFNMQYNTIRSTQSTTGGTGTLPGNTGVYLNTNRFAFYINKNEFTNLRFPINIPIISSTYYNGTTTVTGIYANNLGVLNNYFGPQTTTTASIGTNYIGDAVTITAPVGASWTKQINTGVSVVTNTINRVFRGVKVSGINSYTTVVTSNTISMVDDGMFNATQRGIEISNTTNSVSVATNTLTGPNTTNTLVTLIYAGTNTGTNSPAITCNSLSTSFQAFEFNSTNTVNAVWKGNLMQTHARGLSLTSNGKIGTQGGTNAPSDNQWTGTYTDETYVQTPGDAVNSKLYVRSGSPWQPTLNGGNASATQLYGFAGNIITTTGSYNCGGGGGGGGGDRHANPQTPRSATYSHNQVATANQLLRSREETEQDELTDELKYIEAFSEYKAFDVNDSLRNSDSSNVNYYNSLSNTSIGKFVQAEKYLYAEQINSAMALKSSITPTNNVETNYIKFFDLYNRYKQDNISEDDIVELQSLSNLCPGKDGAIIYNVRALYNVVTKSVITYNENCSDDDQTNVRTFKSSNTATNAYSWDVNLFPNPTSGELNILSRSDSENLELTVRDVSGKIIDKRNLAISGFFGKLDLDLANGVYFITISNSKNESITKKLVITK